MNKGNRKPARIVLTVLILAGAITALVFAVLRQKAPEPQKAQSADETISGHEAENSGADADTSETEKPENGEDSDK